MRRDIPGPTFLEGMLLGNGDVGVCAVVRPDALGIHIGKNDCWDIRVSEPSEDKVLPFADLLEMWKRAGEEAKKQGVKFGVAKFPWTASGRAIANGRDEGFTKLIFSEETHRVIGGAIVGAGAGDLISEIALAVEMGADAVDIGKTIHPHPTTSESVGMAAELYEGVCTDLPPSKRR